MRVQTSSLCVSAALCALCGCAFFLQGCEKTATPVEPPRESPASYMNDPKFRATLSARRKVAESIGEKRAAVARRMEEMVKIMGAKLKTDDRAAVVAALEKLAEWRSLVAKAHELDQEFQKHHRETLDLVRARIAPTNGVRQISK